MTSREIILYHYPSSPYARRVIWYLNLRQIPYSECVSTSQAPSYKPTSNTSQIQPLIMPRPDIKALGISYRRIPILAIGRDIYHDSRLILSKLDTLFPPSTTHPSLSPTTPTHLALASLFSTATTSSGLFAAATRLIPTSLPIFRDHKFTTDRAQLTGHSWSIPAVERARPAALVDIRRFIAFLETGLLADNRAWILGTPQPSVVDLEAVWPLHWVLGMRGAVPPEVASKESFPKVFAWVARFQAAVSEARKRNSKPQALKGFEAAQRVWAAEFAEPAGEVDERDPVGLVRGEEVLVHPTDSGVQHKDRGTLLALDGEEIVIEVTAEKGTVRVHAPRYGFRVLPAQEDAKL